MADQRAVVLVLDDDASVRRALSRLLAVAGFAVRAFASGAELVEADPPRGPACLVLDLRLPGQDGLAVQRDVARRWPALPFVVITGHGDLGTEERARAAGAVAYLEKPFAEETLLAAIERALGRETCE